jgi:hypothetical protein
MKRRVFTILIFLLLGAIINVAVAWACVLFMPLGQGFPPPLIAANPATPAAQHVDWLYDQGWKRPISTRPNMEVRIEAYSIGSPGAELTIISASEYPNRFAGFTGFIPQDHFAMKVDCGWPLRALQGGRSKQSSLRQTTVDGGPTIFSRHGMPYFADETRWWALGPPPGQESFDGRLLPLCPILPGFAVNTALYAGAVWFLFAGPFAVRSMRRALRIKRGLCPACAYPVGESDVCTECGAAVSFPHSRPGIA